MGVPPRRRKQEFQSIRRFLRNCAGVLDPGRRTARGKDGEMCLTRDRTLIAYHEMKRCVTKFPLVGDRGLSRQPTGPKSLHNRDD